MKETFSIEVTYKEDEVDECNLVENVAKVILKKIVRLQGVYGCNVDVTTTAEIIKKVLDEKKNEQ